MMEDRGEMRHLMKLVIVDVVQVELMKGFGT